jgi:uncharacterized protein (TIGR00369 family)
MPPTDGTRSNSFKPVDARPHTVRAMSAEWANRTGPFWDGVNGRVPVPPAAATLGFEFVSADPDNGTIDLAFTATPAFTDPFGNVLGAFLAAMLYDTVGPALLATLEPDRFQTTAELSCQFHRSVQPGRLRASGRVVHTDGEIAHVHATLYDAGGADVATATAVCRVIPLGGTSCASASA